MSEFQGVISQSGDDENILTESPNCASVCSSPVLAGRRCLEAFCIYGSVGRVEEPYVSITRKKQMPRGGQSEEVEQQVGQAEGKLFTHRAAFSRTSVIQAFLGSAPQLTLQLYICVLQETVSIGRGEPAACERRSVAPLPPAVA